MYCKNLNIQKSSITQALSYKSHRPIPSFSFQKQCQKNHCSKSLKGLKLQASATESAKASPFQKAGTTSGQPCDLSFSTWLLQKQSQGQINVEQATVLSSIALACKQIASLVSRSGISNLTGLAGSSNDSGEDQKKLDVLSNIVFSNCLRNSGKTGILASEEEEVPIAVENVDGNYVVVFDPLDGSSNIDAGISVGSIFGIYESDESCYFDASQDPDSVMQKCVVNVCQPGSSLVAAGYCLYSMATTLVLTTGNGVQEFVLDPLIGEFILINDNLRVPESGKIYSFNEGNYALWDDKVKSYINSLKDPEANGGKPYSARYIGSLVADLHRTLQYGGIYGYPADKKNANGKLRLLYENGPMTFIAQQAGGLGTDGSRNILDIVPEKIHQRTPLYIGSKKEVEKLNSYLK